MKETKMVWEKTKLARTKRKSIQQSFRAPDHDVEFLEEYLNVKKKK